MDDKEIKQVFLEYNFFNYPFKYFVRMDGKILAEVGYDYCQNSKNYVIFRRTHFPLDTSIESGVFERFKKKRGLNNFNWNMADYLAYQEALRIAEDLSIERGCSLLNKTIN